MNIVADMHTHTIASGHAYSTLNELAVEAARKGLLAIAITDHGPALPGGPHAYHFGAMRFFPETISGVRIFRGVEANILDWSGTLDLPEHYLKKLDFVMAGLHEGCGFDGEGIGRNTEAVINAMANPLVKAISHPGNPLFPLDYEAVVAAADARSVAPALGDQLVARPARRGLAAPRCHRRAAVRARWCRARPRRGRAQGKISRCSQTVTTRSTANIEAASRRLTPCLAPNFQTSSKALTMIRSSSWLTRSSSQ